MMMGDFGMCVNFATSAYPGSLKAAEIAALSLHMRG